MGGGGGWEGSTRDGKRVAMGRGTMRGGDGEGAMEKEKDDGKGATGRGERGKRWGWGGREEGARGGEISQMDMMECLGGHTL